MVSALREVTLQRARLLLVEGADEARFMEPLCNHLQLANIQIIPYGGKNRLGGFLRALTRMHGFETVERLAVVRDADENAGSAFQSVQSALESADLPVPAQVESFEDGKPQVSVLIMPPGSQDGCLESLLWEMITSKDAGMAQCIGEFIDCTSTSHMENSLDKARIYAYLSVQRRPGLRIGEAAEAGQWDFNHNLLNPLNIFVRGLSS